MPRRLPVRPAFCAPPSQGRARARLGVPGTARCVLLMSGAWGLGPVAEAAAGLLEALGVHAERPDEEDVRSQETRGR